MDGESLTTDRPVIDLQQAEEFLLAMFDDYDWAMIGPADRERQWVQPSEGCEDFEAKLAKVAGLNNSGCCIFVGANPRKGDGLTGREGTKEARSYFADFDGGTTPEQALDTIRKAGLPEPSIIVFSGNGTHPYWLLHEPESDLSEWENRMRWIAYALGSHVADHLPKPVEGDPDEELYKQQRKEMLAQNAAADSAVCDRQRIMRIPGFVNRKQDYAGNPPLARLVKCDPSLRYSWKDLQPKCSRPPEEVPPVKPIKKERKPGSLSAGDDFNDRAEWFKDVFKDEKKYRKSGLETKGYQGWEYVPLNTAKKTFSISVESEESESCVYVWDSDFNKLPSGEHLTKWAAYTFLNHKGDFTQSALELSERGYGKQGHGEECVASVPEKVFFTSVIALKQSGESIKNIVDGAPCNLFSNSHTRSLLQSMQQSDDDAAWAAVISNAGDGAASFVEKLKPYGSDSTTDAHHKAAMTALADMLEADRKQKHVEALSETLEGVEAGDVVSGAILRRLADHTDDINGGTGDVTLSQAFDRLLQPKKRTIYTGVATFDTGRSGGLPIGLTVLAAKPGCGKSALALQMALGAMAYDPNISTLWCLGEMTTEDIIARAAAVWGKITPTQAQFDLTANGGGPVKFDDLWNKDRSEMSLEAVATAHHVLKTFGDRMIINDVDSFSIDNIEAAAGRNKPDIIIVDYFQLIQIDAGDNKVDQLERIAARLVQLSKQHEAAVIAISSMAGGTDVKVGAGGITKGSTSLDYGAHLMYVGEPVSDTEDGERRVNWLNKKNRYGMQRDVETIFNGDHMWFRSPDFVTDFDFIDPTIKATKDTEEPPEQQDLEGF